jgi:hypothetical protein
MTNSDGEYYMKLLQRSLWEQYWPYSAMINKPRPDAGNSFANYLDPMVASQFINDPFNEKE